MKAYLVCTQALLYALFRALPKVSRNLAAAVLAASVVGCAPTSQFPQIDESLAEAEAHRQRVEAVRSHVATHRRLHDVSFRVLKANVPLCGDKVDYFGGLTWLSLSKLPKEWHQVFQSQFGVTDELTVLNVVEGSPAEAAGVLPGDKVVKVDGAALGSGRRASRTLESALNKSDAARITLTISRNGALSDRVIHRVMACSPEVLVHDADSVNAYTDGRRVVITAGMMRFIESDDDLALIVGHELAHITRGHIEAQQGNMLIGALIGAVAGGLAGVDMTQAGADIGAMAFSQEFEAEADYVGVYHAARAGYDVEKAADLWRRMARIHPQGINLLGSTHPSTAKRFLAIQAAANEVRRKLNAGQLLVPEERE